MFFRRLHVIPSAQCTWRNLKLFVHFDTQCKFALAVWKLFPLSLGSAAIWGIDFQLWFTTLLARWKVRMDSDWLILIGCARIWGIWKCRNDVCFLGSVSNSIDFMEAQRSNEYIGGDRPHLFLWYIRAYDSSQFQT